MESENVAPSLELVAGMGSKNSHHLDIPNTLAVVAIVAVQIG